MSNAQSNFPTAAASRQLDGQAKTGETISCLMELSEMGRPRTDAELENRIKQYFDFCKSRNFKPGVESLCLALGTTRTSFWNWCRRDRCEKSDNWIEICQQAKQLITAFTEESTLNGQLSPPVGIFALKNIGNWKDTVSFEDASTTGADIEQRALKINELPDLSALGIIDDDIKEDN